ncbi:hypothetical protein O181_024728 [Austropuccinia psidii MF-1]|uniref:Retrotransposon gag domain-containing protein n=1 Tax=Austropuccinia psidii MF-1 TaxID=1389203 RepID=A0A9Q3CJF5_9BASI|nr:hypothetical protein [Austropuccinia psidii MF-1]
MSGNALPVSMAVTSTLQKRRSRSGEAEDEEGEDSEETEVAGAPEASEAPNLAHSNQPLVSQAEPNFLKMMEQMTQFMGELTQAVSPRETLKAPAFKTPSMKALDSLMEEGFELDLFLTVRTGKWIEPYLSNISNEDPSYLLNVWQLFETQLFTLFGDPNEVRKLEQELDNLRMKEKVQVSFYIANFGSLMSRIKFWQESAHIHLYRRGLASRLLAQLASHLGIFDSLQELMDITLELQTRYHERRKKKGSHQEKKRPISQSNYFMLPQNSSSKKLSHRKNKKGKNFQVSKAMPHAALLTQDNKLIGSEKERMIKEGLCNHCGEKHQF